jgi:hypothetical protein
LIVNERIRELADQCYHQYSEHNIDLEKFAELIVRECMSLCQECIDDGCVEAVEPMGRIKEHFGVEW